MKTSISLNNGCSNRYSSRNLNFIDSLTKKFRQERKKRSYKTQKGLSKRVIALETLEDRILLANCSQMEANFTEYQQQYAEFGFILSRNNTQVLDLKFDEFVNKAESSSDAHNVAKTNDLHIERADFSAFPDQINKQRISITDSHSVSNHSLLEHQDEIQHSSDDLLLDDSFEFAGPTKIPTSINENSVAQNTQETPSMTVTTASDTVDPNDGLISLREAITVYSGTAGSNTVDFGSNMRGTTIVLNDEIIVADDITIDATSLNPASESEIQTRNVTISGNNQRRLFTITGGTSTRPVNLIALNLCEGNGTKTGTPNEYDNFGGAILNLGYLLIKNCDLYDNHVTRNGGAIANRTNLTLDNTDCYDNTAVYGGAIFNSGTTTIQPTCKLYRNTATKNGGAISNISTLQTDSSGNVTGGTLGILTISNADIYNNSSTSGFGGGIGNWGSATLTNTDLYGNSAGENGGAITNGPAFILSQVDNNQTLYDSLPKSSMTIITSIIGGIDRTANSAKYGGGIINSTTLTINGSTISNNNASVNGGGLSNTTDGILTLGNSGTTPTTFSNNQANNGFGGGILNVQTATISITSGSTVTLSNNSDSTSTGTGTGDGNFTTSNYNLPITYVYDSNTKTSTMTPATSSSRTKNSSPNNFGVLSNIALQKGMSMILDSFSSKNLVYAFDFNQDGTIDLQTSSLLDESELGFNVGKHSVLLTVKTEQGVSLDPFEIELLIVPEPLNVSFCKSSLLDDRLIRLNLSFSDTNSYNDPLILDWGDGNVVSLNGTKNNLLIHYYERSGQFPISIQTPDNETFFLTTQMVHKPIESGLTLDKKINSVKTTLSNQNVQTAFQYPFADFVDRSITNTPFSGLETLDLQNDLERSILFAENDDWFSPDDLLEEYSPEIIKEQQNGLIWGLLTFSNETYSEQNKEPFSPLLQRQPEQINSLFKNYLADYLP
ncbi:MAG: hypothetical protein Q4C95_12560 [Planctomycetia bacterium]|nr:hypothetical protein [Planctomycetia bacterium]